MTYIALIGTDASVVPGTTCDVMIASEGGLTVDLPSTPLGVSFSDPDKLDKAQRAAEAVLAERGWKLTSSWEIGDSQLYAPAEPVSA